MQKKTKHKEKNNCMLKNLVAIKMIIINMTKNTPRCLCIINWLIKYTTLSFPLQIFNIESMALFTENVPWSMRRRTEWKQRRRKNTKMSAAVTAGCFIKIGPETSLREYLWCIAIGARCNRIIRFHRLGKQCMALMNSFTPPQLSQQRFMCDPALTQDTHA